MASIKKYNNGSWTDVKFKKYNNGSWTDANVYKYNNGWTKISSQQYTTTWTATWSQTYDLGGTRLKTWQQNLNRMYQGDYASDAHGLQMSLFGFNISNIRSSLSGATIKKVELYLRNQHWYYYAGGTAFLGYHNHSTKPNKFSHSVYKAVSQKFSGIGEARWITLPNAYGNGLRDSKHSGLSICANSTSIGYYGYFYGANTSYAPKLKITYEK